VALVGKGYSETHWWWKGTLEPFDATKESVTNQKLKSKRKMEDKPWLYLDNCVLFLSKVPLACTHSGAGDEGQSSRDSLFGVKEKGKRKS
jgi:hypothetical protein